MSSAIAHTGCSPRKCWDENQYRLLHAAIAPALITSGKKLLNIVDAAMVAHIAPAEHRQITATVAKQVWKKAQQAVKMASLTAFPAAAQAATQTAAQTAAQEAAPANPVVLKCSKADAINIIPHLPVGSVIELL